MQPVAVLRKLPKEILTANQQFYEYVSLTTPQQINEFLHPVTFVLNYGEKVLFNKTAYEDSIKYFNAAV